MLTHFSKKKLRSVKHIMFWLHVLTYSKFTSPAAAVEAYETCRLHHFGNPKKIDRILTQLFTQLKIKIIFTPIIPYILRYMNTSSLLYYTLSGGVGTRSIATMDVWRKTEATGFHRCVLICFCDSPASPSVSSPVDVSFWLTNTCRAESQAEMKLKFTQNPATQPLPTK